MLTALCCQGACSVCMAGSMQLDYATLRHSVHILICAAGCFLWLQSNAHRLPLLLRLLELGALQVNACETKAAGGAQRHVSVVPKSGQENRPPAAAAAVGLLTHSCSSPWEQLWGCGLPSQSLALRHVLRAW